MRVIFRAVCWLAVLTAPAGLAAQGIGDRGDALPIPPEPPPAANEKDLSPSEKGPLPDAGGAPPEGKRIPDAENSCILCHENLTEPDQKRVLVRAKDFAGDAHWQKGLRCQDCHGGDPSVLEIKAHQARDDFRVVKSPADLPDVCGPCHAESLASYSKSYHGQGLFKMGLLCVPSCADCHGGHGIYRPSDPRSPLSSTRVAATCGKCHRFIEQTLEASVHGHGAGGMAKRRAAGGTGNHKPSCTSCHQGHDLPTAGADAFRLRSPSRCGDCHARLSTGYAMSIHGKLSELGYGPAARCSDCHGAHDILPVSDPGSRLAPDRRAETCGSQQCHPGASGNFLKFDPHTDYTDPVRSPVVHAVYLFFLTLLFSVFGIFGLHSVLWFARGVAEVTKHERAKALRPGEPAYVRFSTFHRIGHAALLVSFLGLALTGLPLKYSHTAWGKALAHALGGFAWTSLWHRFFGLVTFACFVVYLVRLARLYRDGRRQGIASTSLIFGPDSPVPARRDAVDFYKMLRWFVGRGPKPTFDRWTYWEKFDFWGAVGDIVIIGFTGLILWFPGFFCRFLPATAVNIAQVVHATQALLATGFVFAIHFFNTHMRPEKFPADMSVLTGLVSEEEFREERPELYERLRRQGELEQIRTTVPGRSSLWLLRLGGFVALAIGLALLAGMIAAGIGG